GALGPGAREWTGAATYPHIRTIFMWLGASGEPSYFDTTLVHEVTHVVFADATDNPFHEPAKWLNEGLATWAETQSADPTRSTVEFEASGGGLFAFAAIAEQFPIGDSAARLSYAQGATMVDMIVSDYGRDALAAIAAAYRDGASDDEALRAGTGVPADQLYAAYYDEFGVEPPQPVAPEPILPSNVRKPGGGASAPASGEPGATPGATPSGPAGGGDIGPWVVLGVLLVVAVVGIAAAVAQRRVRRSEVP
ncbi:MAG TPA: peptidase MA family metallohydrolase, partial [Candidatus Limnocylindria bacterium]